MGAYNSVTQRFTPTRVGTMNKSFSSVSLKPVHPHTRGDNVFGAYNHFPTARFTPTRVGTIF